MKEQVEVPVSYRPDPNAEAQSRKVILEWNVGVIESTGVFQQLSDELDRWNKYDDFQQSSTELGAVGVAVAVLGDLTPDCTVTRIVARGEFADLELNGDRRQMVEVAGLYRGGPKTLARLFEKESRQISRNEKLRQAWVSVTIFHKLRNRTEQLPR